MRLFHFKFCVSDFCLRKFRKINHELVDFCKSYISDFERRQREKCLVRVVTFFRRRKGKQQTLPGFGETIRVAIYSSASSSSLLANGIVSQSGNNEGGKWMESRVSLGEIKSLWLSKVSVWILIAISRAGKEIGLFFLPSFCFGENLTIYFDLGLIFSLYFRRGSESEDDFAGGNRVFWENCW